MKTIPLFLASSAELKLERLEIAELLLQLNPYLKAVNTQIQLIKWEHMDSSMGARHKQEEYNDKLRTCELCFVLYGAQLGQYTQAELDLAYQQMQAGQLPRQVAIAFKRGESRSAELQKLKESISTLYPHCHCTEFADSAECRLQILELLVHYLAQHELPQLQIHHNKLVLGAEELCTLHQLGIDS